jgi:hypothetical protein
LHLAVILVGCLVTGVLVTTMLHVVGLQEMLVRYPIALLASYAFFILGIRIWLQYVGYVRGFESGRRGLVDDASAGNGGWWTGSGRSTGRSLAFRAGGGAAGGDGASGGFDISDASAKGAAGGMATGGRASGAGGEVDLGDGTWVISALAAAAAAVFGAAAYLIYAAPSILCDAAFAALLSGGLVRSSRRIATTGWMGSVVRDTWLPFACVLVLTLVFAAVSRHVYPDAHTVLEVLRRF